MKETQELVVLQPELKEIVTNSNIELSTAEKMASEYAIHLTEITRIGREVAKLSKDNPEDAVKAKRFRLDLGKLSAPLTEIKKAHKEKLLIQTRFADALYNTCDGAKELTQKDAEEIEKHQERLEAIRLNELETSRKLLLEPYGEVNLFVDLKKMDDETFNKYLSNEKLAFETRLEQEKQAELVRIEAEKKAETERLEAERLAKIEQEKKDAELAELKNKQDLRAARTQELQPYIVFIRDYNALIELPEKEYKAQFSDIKKGAELEWEAQRKQMAEDAKKEQEAEEKRKKDELEAKRLQAENDKLKQQQEQEKARIEAEEAEKLAKEKALLNAGDREKVKHFYETFKLIAFPELNSDEGKDLSKGINEGLAMLRKAITEGLKTLLD